MSSWADDINSYNKRNSAPELVPMKRFLRKAKEKEVSREYDIVTCHVKDPETKITMQERDEQISVNHVNKAVRKELNNCYHGYNLVTQQPLYGISDDSVSAMGGNQESKGKKVQAPKQFIDYNIVNHRHLPAEQLKGLDEEAMRNDKSNKPKMKTQRNIRNTNILNHLYLHDHEGKTKKDEEKMRQYVETVSAENRDLNPITALYYNSAKEDMVTRECQGKDEKKRQHVSDHTYKTSGIVARSEGHAFDIVTNKVYNPEKVLKLELQNQKGILQRADLRQKWEYQRDVEEALRDADVQRALNRMSNQRILEVRDRGYDILSHTSFEASKSAAAGGGITHDSLKQCSTLEKLHHSMEPRAWTTNNVLRETGPRTTHEKVFQAPAGSSATHVSSFAGRRELLLPSMKKSTSQPVSGF